MGIMKIVGDAVKQGQTLDLSHDRMTHALRCIGIGSWGYTMNNKCLESSNGKVHIVVVDVLTNNVGTN